MAKHPIIREDTLKSIRIPDLMGGINLRDSVSMINDNQLTECHNMWWADGALRTRPGVKEQLITKVEMPEGQGTLKENESSIKRHNCFKEDNGIKGQLCSVKSSFVFSYTDEEENQVAKIVTRINFFWCFGASNIALEPLNIEDTQKISSYFAVWHNDTVYCFSSNRQIHKYVDGLNKWTEVKEEDTEDGRSRIYVPLVAAYCKTNGEITMSADEVIESGVMYEGYNLLSSYYRIQYEAFNYEVATEKSETDKTLCHKMKYFLLEKTNKTKYEGMVITAIHRKNGVDYEHSITLQGENWYGNWLYEANYGSDGLKMGVFKDRINFISSNADAYITENDAYSTIEISAPFIPDNRDTELNRIFTMQNSCWYGGSAEGLDGGTRLFLCGSETDKALVTWSGRNNPLYFPENSYFYVGDKSAAVTGFGKQSNLLIIFKNNETWCTQYYRNTNIEAKSLINQTVVDYTSSSVYFPLILINSNIGCAYPDTIELCRNRLVWLTNNGQVCTLISENQYNERTVFCVSEMVSLKLRNEKGEPTACDWNGHYILSFENRLYLMDYNSYGYQYVTSYSKTEDANLRIPWYCWELPRSSKQSVLTNIYDRFEYICLDGEKIYGCSIELGNTNDIADDMTTRKVDYSFTTKLFDFNAPSTKKNIQLVNLLMGANGYDVIRVELVTEHGIETQEIELDGGETHLRSAGYITNKALFPCIRAVRIFGVRISGSGDLAVDGMQFNYRMLGGIR